MQTVRETNPTVIEGQVNRIDKIGATGRHVFGILSDQIPVAPPEWRASVFGCGSVRMGVLPRDEGIVAGHGARSVGATLLPTLTRAINTRRLRLENMFSAASLGSVVAPFTNERSSSPFRLANV